MEDLASGTKKRVLPSWMTAQAVEKRKAPVHTPKRRRMAAVAMARNHTRPLATSAREAPCSPKHPTPQCSTLEVGGTLELARCLSVAHYHLRESPQ
uniref:Cell cycle regulator of NHEJ n=1 Tax=Oryctolagus cuniculus TaxID=9986 RepID=A0A5F9DHG1_RABIT